MREPIKDKGRLEHIITAINNVQEYTDGVSHDELLWNVIHEDLPPFKQQILNFLTEIL